MIERISRFLLAVFVVSVLPACSMLAPKAAVSVQQTLVLRDSGAAPVKVGTFAAGADAHDQSISIRGSGMTSPYGSYAKYLEEAMRLQLREAGLFDEASKAEISGTLMKNDINASGFVTASGDISARFQVKRGEKIVYDTIQEAHVEWGSNFLGAIAIPRAQEAYPGLVSTLLGALFGDAAFLGSLKSAKD